jgi:hypothetical protein
VPAIFKYLEDGVVDLVLRRCCVDDDSSGLGNFAEPFIQFGGRNRAGAGDPFSWNSFAGRRSMSTNFSPASRRSLRRSAAMVGTSLVSCPACVKSGQMRSSQTGSDVTTRRGFTFQLLGLAPALAHQELFADIFAS